VALHSRLLPLLIAGWAVIGETAKWVPINNARITSISYSATSVTVTAAGVNGESLTVCLCLVLVW
jgi:hypothetical protein